MSFLLGAARHVVLWPQPHQLNDSIGCWGKIGRVIHWSGAAIASNLLVIGVAAAALDPTIDPLKTINLMIVLAALVYFPARGIRLLMARE